MTVTISDALYRRLPGSLRAWTIRSLPSDAELAAGVEMIPYAGRHPTDYGCAIAEGLIKKQAIKPASTNGYNSQCYVLTESGASSIAEALGA